MVICRTEKGVNDICWQSTGSSVAEANKQRIVIIFFENVRLFAFRENPNADTKLSGLESQKMSFFRKCIFYF
jgi:hypothetical protein